jgi:lipopolysaccharide export system protein LptA
VQKIEAVENVFLAQGETQARSGRAVYDTKENVIRLLEKPSWKSGAREGSSDSLILDRSNNTFAASGSVYMKLPFTNVVGAVSRANQPSGTNCFLQIYSDQFHFTNAGTNGNPSHAEYTGQVRARYEQTELHCERLNVFFAANNQVRAIVAEENVVIASENGKAFGEKAAYDVGSDKMTLTGNPHWDMEGKTGSSRLVTFYGKSKEIYALENVEMTMPARSLPALDLFGPGQRAKEPASTNGNENIHISAGIFSHGGDISVFHDDVRVRDKRGELRCEMVTITSGSSNQVERIVAEDHVVITQEQMVAKGKKAIYDVPLGKIYLTGNPVVLSDGKSIEAEAFIIDRHRNTFSVKPGEYRIKLNPKTKPRILAR